MYGSIPGNGEGIASFLRTKFTQPTVVPRWRFGWVLIDPDRRLGGEGTERPHAADAVPRIPRRRRLALTLVALQEAGDEQFLRQRRQLHPPRLPVLDQLIRIVEVNHLDHG